MKSLKAHRSEEIFSYSFVLFVALSLFRPTNTQTTPGVSSCPPGSSFGPTPPCLCHCLSGTNVCDPASGSCSDYQCDRGWTGTPYCQTACNSTTYGVNCNYLCHCPINDTCSPINGYCSSGFCSTDWGGTSCQIRLPKLTVAPSVDNITCSRVTVSWAAWNPPTDVGSSPVISYSIQQRLNSSMGSSSSRTNVWTSLVNISTTGNPPSFSYTVSITDPYSYIEYAILCYWADYSKLLPGLPSPSSNIVRPITACVDPPSRVNSLSAIVNGPRAVVSWTPPSNLVSGLILYNVSLSSVGIGDCNLTGVVLIGQQQVNSQTPTATFNNLTAWTNYQVSVTAINVGGAGETQTTNFISQEIVPTGAVSNVVLQSVTSRDATLTWDDVTCSQRGGILSFYQVTATDVARPSSVIDRTTAVKSVRLQSLTPHTTYNVVVLYANRVGLGPSSAPITITTAQDVPPAPTNVITSYQSANSIYVTWSAPTPTNGVLSNYRVLYWITGQQSNGVVMTATTDATTTGVNITGLQPYTGYSIQVQGRVSNVQMNDGWGNVSSAVSDTTLEGLPTAPLNLVMLSRSDTCIMVSWTQPATINGQLLAYTITCSPTAAGSGQAPVIQIALGSQLQAPICSLVPAVLYTVQVQARTGAGLGSPASIDVWTEIGWPDKPPSPIVVYAGNWTITISIEPVILTTGPLSAYFVIAALDDGATGSSGRRKRRAALPDPVTASYLGLPGSAYTAAQLLPSDVRVIRNFTVGDGVIYNGYTNHELQRNRFYSVYYVVASSLDGVTKMAVSKMGSSVMPGTNPTIIQVTTTIPPATGAPIGTGGLSTGAIVGIVLASILLALLLAALILLLCCCWKKRQQREKEPVPYRTFENIPYKKHQLAETFAVPPTPPPPVPPPPQPKSSKISQKWNRTYTTDEMRYVVLDTPDLMDTQTVGGRSPISFEDEYRKLPAGSKYSCRVAKMSINAERNRFKHILAYDDYRVKLVDNPVSDYVNASYIPSYDRRIKGYIAAQSPFSEATICEFWRMILQEGVSQVVFMSKLVEDGIVKSEQYWANDYETRFYGSTSVTLLAQETFANFVIRSFMIQDTTAGTHRRPVKQYQFTAWPEHGVPSCPIALLEFRNKIRSEAFGTSSGNDRPLLVHCGTGISRTGVFIAVDYCLEESSTDGRVNVFKCCLAMRRCRPMIVRTQKQYEFIYDVLFEALLTRDYIITRDMKSAYSTLNQPVTPNGETPFKQQAQLLEKWTPQPKDEDCSEAMRSANVNKNRFNSLSLVPRDRDRPVLECNHRGSVKHQYINALFVDSYTRKRAFIVTQTPLAHTVKDFWTLVHQYNINRIVNLSASSFKEDSCVDYIPQREGDTLKTPTNLSVTLMSIEPSRQTGTTVRTITLTDNNQKTRTVKQYQFESWKMYDPVPSSHADFLHLIKMLGNEEETNSDQFNTDVVVREEGTPILVHCIDGANQSGLFVACYNICQKMQIDNRVDIFHTVKEMKTKRFHFINSLHQYKFCFKLVWDFINIDQLTGELEDSKD